DRTRDPAAAAARTRAPAAAARTCGAGRTPAAAGAAAGSDASRCPRRRCPTCPTFTAIGANVGAARQRRRGNTGLEYTNRTTEQGGATHRFPRMPQSARPDQMPRRELSGRSNVVRGPGRVQQVHGAPTVEEGGAV